MLASLVIFLNFSCGISINNKMLRPRADNLALGHEASPETQLPPSRVGLRVMHRVTVAGKTPPKK